jgi:hypothetical protein
MRLPETAIQQRNRSDIDKEKAENNKKLALTDVGKISGVALGGLGLLIVLSFWLTAGRIPFIVGAAVPLFTLFAVIYQAVVYHRQWQAMKESLKRTDLVIERMQSQIAASNTQTEVMRKALVVSNSAVVAVHSVELNKAERTVLVRIENTGNLPAGDIRVFLRLFTFGPPEWNGKGDLPNQATKSVSVRMSYGRTKLFKGNLPILLPFILSDWTASEFRNIEKGTHNLTLIGYVEYSDEFFPERVKRTEFVLGYLSELGVWCTDSPNFADTVGWESEDTEEI